MTKPPLKLNEPQVEYAPRTQSSEAPEVDQSQIERNLALTPEERVIEHQHALDLVLALEAAGRSLRDKPQ